MAKNDTTPRQDAIEMVQMLEARLKDPNKILAALNKEYEKSTTMTGEAQQRQVRMVELAKAYIDVSDGKGGVNNGAHANELARWNKTVSGLSVSSQNYPLESQRLAVAMNRPDLMTDEAKAKFPNMGRSPMSEHSVGISHGNEGARVSSSARPAAKATDPIGVTSGGAGGRPSRGFATVAMMATTAVITAIAIPALQHITQKPAESSPGVNMTALSKSSGSLNATATAPAQNNLQAKINALRAPKANGPG